jgi:hypothetical protein
VTLNAMGYFRTVGIVMALSAVTGACFAASFPDYPILKARDCAVTTEAAGVTIGVQPVDDLKEQKEYFNAVLTSQGFVPVFVVLQNGSNGDSFLIDTSKITYGSADSEIAAPKVGLRKAAAITTFFVPFVGPFAAAKIISGPLQVQQNLLKKGLESTTLSTGASAHGFLYVPVPKNAPREKIRLRVPITKAGTNDTFILDVAF